MCTAVSYAPNGMHFFGRNLDLEISYKESVIITHKNKSLPFRCTSSMFHHYSIIGIGIISDDYPLYFDAMNEYGLAMAGLNFPGNAAYFPPVPEQDNIAPYELIPWILGQCRNLSETKNLLSNLNITDIPFSSSFPLSPLHWMIADQRHAITLESTADGLHIYDNPIGILTNNPPFPYHMHNLSNYQNLSRKDPINHAFHSFTPEAFSRGMGTIGLPGDYSSPSRFIRAAYVKENSVCDSTQHSAVNQFFQILQSVAHPRGCVSVGNKFEYTVYSSCCDLDKGVYYYKTYENSRICAISLKPSDETSDQLISFPIINKADIQWNH